MDSTQTAASRFTLVTSENIPGRTWVVVLAPELQQNQTVYVPIDTRAVLDSSGNSLVGLVDSDSNFAVADQIIFPKGTTVTFQVGEVRTTTTIVISFTVSVPLAGEMPICLVQATQRLGWILPPLFSWTERGSSFSQSLSGRWARSILRSTSTRPPLSSTCHVALARPASLNVVALHSEEPLEDLFDSSYRFHEWCS